MIFSNSGNWIIIWIREEVISNSNWSDMELSCILLLIDEVDPYDAKYALGEFH